MCVSWAAPLPVGFSPLGGRTCVTDGKLFLKWPPNRPFRLGHGGGGRIVRNSVHPSGVCVGRDLIRVAVSTGKVCGY